MCACEEAEVGIVVHPKWKSIIPHIIIAAVILVVTFLLARIDWIVHHTLYDYGLIFGLEWAYDYWFALRSILVLLNLSLGVIVVAGFFSYRRAKEETMKTVFICEFCGEPFVRFNGNVNLKGPLPRLRILKKCPFCNIKLQEASVIEKVDNPVDQH